MREIVEKYRHGVVQIGTATGNGTGFYIKEYDLIVTNYHVVSQFLRVVLAGKSIKKQVAEVVFTDPKLDLAFINPPKDSSGLSDLKTGDYHAMKDGDSVIAIGHPLGLNYTATKGVISRVDRVKDGIKYIQIDAAINPGNSGGPLVNMRGEIIGVNTFIIKGGINLGFALPVSYLKETLDIYYPLKGQYATRCPSCSAIISEKILEGSKYCPNCGYKINLPDITREYNAEVSGIGLAIENVLIKIGCDIRLARNGKNSWEIDHGSAKVRIIYNPKNYFIISDAVLCYLPQQNIGKVYEYLLRENLKTRDMVFSIKENRIMLSCLICDMDFNEGYAYDVLKNLFESADRYDAYLINTYDCKPILAD